MRGMLLAGGLIAALGLMPVGVAAQSTKPAAKPAKVAKAASSDPVFQGRKLSEWVADLSAAAPLTRSQAAYAISALGPKAKSAVPALIKELDDPAPTARYPVIYALGEIGPDAKEAIPALQKLTDDRVEDIAHMAKKSIKKINGELPIGDQKPGT